MPPVRLRLSRKKGFNLQAWSRATNGLEALKADRSTGLGNPFRVTYGQTKDVWFVGSWNGPAMWVRPTKDDALNISLRAYREWIKRPQNASALSKAKGKNIACWCRLGEPCHADVLLELANEPEAPQ